MLLGENNRGSAEASRVCHRRSTPPGSGSSPATPFYRHAGLRVSARALHTASPPLSWTQRLPVPAVPLTERDLAARVSHDQPRREPSHHLLGRSLIAPPYAFSLERGVAGSVGLASPWGRQRCLRPAPRAPPRPGYRDGASRTGRGFKAGAVHGPGVIAANETIMRQASTSRSNARLSPGRLWTSRWGGSSSVSWWLPVTASQPVAAEAGYAF